MEGLLAKEALTDIRVLDLSRLLPGPYCTMLLREFGAEVIKVEDTGDGDYLRLWPPHPEDQPQLSAMFTALNRGKSSVRIDLKHAEGPAILRRLVETADVLVESFRPGVMARFGLDYPQLAQLNPQLIYCSISGYGQQGQFSQRAGHDLNFQALSGVLSLAGKEGEAPPVPAVQVADIGGGALAATVEILAALRARDRVGAGCQIDISMAAATQHWLAMPLAALECDGRQPQPGGELLSGGVICYNTYLCSDGRAVALAALEPKFWRMFCEGVGRLDLQPHATAEVGSLPHRQLTELFLSRTQAQWAEFADGCHCCLEPILTLKEASQLTLFTDDSSSHRLDRQPDISAPQPGEHTVLQLKRLGFSEQEIDRLLQLGVCA